MPVALLSAMMSERIGIVAVPLPPVPWPVITVKVVAENLAVPMPSV